MSVNAAWVTGGAGFLGRAVVDRMLRRGVAVRCLVRSASAADALLRSVDETVHDRLHVVVGSLTSPEDCRRLVDGLSHGIHVAATGSGSTASLFMNNVVGTRQLLSAVRRAGCDRMVLVSSIAVHGTDHLRPGQTVDESCPIDPRPELRDAYTFSKIAQERLCHEAGTEWGLPLVVVRPGVIYGPGRDCVTSRVGLRIGPAFVQIGGRHKLPYTYVDNCADAIVAALCATGAVGGTFDVVDDEVPTGNQVVRRFRAKAGSLRVVKVPAFAIGPLSRLYLRYSHRSRGQLPPVLTPYRCAASWKPLRYSNARAKAVLGWQPETPLSIALDRTLAAWTSRVS